MMRHAARAFVVFGLTLLIPALTQGAVLDLYVSSINDNSVKRYNGTTGAFVDNFVPTQSGGLTTPTGQLFGPDGNFYVSSLSTNQVMRYSGSTGAPLPSGGNSGAVFAQGGGLSLPEGIVFGADGNLYVSGALSNDVLKYNGTTGAFIGTFASGNGLSSPTGLVFGPNGDLFVNSSGNNQVLEFNGTTGAFVKVFANSSMSGPLDLKFSPVNGNLYVSNNTSTTISEFNGTTGALITTFTGGGLNGPAGLAFGADSLLYVSSLNTNQVLRFDPATGAFVDVFVTAGSGGLNQPDFLSFGPAAPLVPEPSSLALAGLGLCAIVGFASRRRLRKLS